MAKRKAGLNDIIYELDNDDIELSSDDEAKHSKIHRLESLNITNLPENEINVQTSSNECNRVETLSEENTKNSSPANVLIGGKPNDVADCESQNGEDSQQSENAMDIVKKTSADCCKTTILNEDIVVDSPGNSDLGVEGCENRTPLITVRFRDNKLASSYKEQIKAFMLNLIKLHGGENIKSDNETDLELDIWPEDLAEEVEETLENSLFFVDTVPGVDGVVDVPRYSQTSAVISNIPEKEPTPPPMRKGPTCFNCDGNHSLRDCQRPKDLKRIASRRKNMPARVGRYHVEDEQKFGHLIPGRISGKLRHALGLKRHELPLHIYRMRMLGYPPGWLEEARISHSGISMFDSSGTAILEPDDEEGEICEPGTKDKFDIKKILDFPGFNVACSSRYKEEADLLGLPPMSEQDSKLAMLQFLAPNAMKAYKRKKLTMFPSAASNNVTMQGQTEMELDSGDEATEFPSVPPLPDEAPPTPPPPPPCPPPGSPPRLPSPPREEQIPEPDKGSGDDLEVINVLRVGDIPMPLKDFIVIDEDESEVDKSQSSNRSSPSLCDLEAKKQLLLDALETPDDNSMSQDNDNISNNIEEIIIKTNDNETISDDISNNIDKEKIVEIETNVDVATCDDEKIDKNELQSEISKLSNSPAIDNSQESVPTSCTSISESVISGQVVDSQESTLSNQLMDTPTSTSSQTCNSQASSDILKTPDSKTGTVKGTDYGTPVMNIASPYVQLPSNTKFSKDICDVINFENLPNSTGKYKQISVLLKKVKSEVDRIQDS